MPAYTLFEILQVSHNATDAELRAAYEERVLWCMRRNEDVPAHVKNAYEILRHEGRRKYYIELLEARRRTEFKLVRLDELSFLQQFCQLCSLSVYECPRGIIGNEGRPATLEETYVGICFLNERPVWETQQQPESEQPPSPPPPSVVSRIIRWSILGIILGGAFWWYHFEYHAAERLQEAIRSRDADAAITSDSIAKREGLFRDEIVSVVGTLPSDGSMPSELAKVCFHEPTAARAWGEIRERKTTPASLTPLNSDRKQIEDRIAMGTFVEADKTRLESIDSTLHEISSSFTDLERDLDLLRVLLEASRLPHVEPNTAH